MYTKEITLETAKNAAIFWGLLITILALIKRYGKNRK